MGVVLSEYLNKSHNFTNVIFYDVTLRYSIVTFVARNLCVGTYRRYRIFVWNGMKLQHAVCIINVWACA